MRHITMHNPLFAKPVERKARPAPFWFKLLLVLLEFLFPLVLVVSPTLNRLSGFGHFN